MKKIILSASLVASTFALAQNIGINTSTPKTTLHIVQPGVTSSIAQAYIKTGAIITGNSTQSNEGVGQYYENIGNPTGYRVVKNELSNQGTYGFFGFGTTSDNADSYLKTLYGVNLDTGNFSIGLLKGAGASEKLDVNGNARIRVLAIGTNTDATTGFPNMVVAKADGTLGYTIRSAGNTITKTGTTSFAGAAVDLGVSFTDYVPVMIKNKAASNQTNTTFAKDNGFAYEFTQIGANWQLDFYSGAGNTTNYTTASDVMVEYEVRFIRVAP